MNARCIRRPAQTRAIILEDFMGQATRPLPRFRHPPVVETVLGVFFLPIADFTIARRGIFWGRFLAQEFPKLEEKPPLNEVREEFGDSNSPSGAEIQIRWQAAPPSPRLWAKSIDDRHTIQIQNDAILANWERDQDREPYWPYAERKHAFSGQLRRLDQFLRDEQIGQISPTTCFVQYVNHIELQEGFSFGQFMSHVLSIWKSDTSDNWLPPADMAILNCSFPMPDKRGRLHVNAVPAIRHKDNRRIVRLDLTARGAAQEDTIDAALEWLDLGHEWIVRGFASLTTPEMHQHWERHHDPIDT